MLLFGADSLPNPDLRVWRFRHSGGDVVVVPEEVVFRCDLPVQGALLGQSQKHAAFGSGCSSDTSQSEMLPAKKKAQRILRRFGRPMPDRVPMDEVSPHEVVVSEFTKSLSVPSCR